MVLPKLEQHRFAANAPSTELMSPSFFYSQIYLPVRSSHHWLNAQFGTLVGAKPDQLEHILISAEVRKIWFTVTASVVVHGCCQWTIHQKEAMTHSHCHMVQPSSLTGILFYSLKN